MTCIFILPEYFIYSNPQNILPSLPTTGGRTVMQVSEGEETDEFWSFLGGKGEYPQVSEGWVTDMI